MRESYNITFLLVFSVVVTSFIGASDYNRKNNMDSNKNSVKKPQPSPRASYTNLTVVNDISLRSIKNNFRIVGLIIQQVTLTEVDSTFKRDDYNYFSSINPSYLDHGDTSASISIPKGNWDVYIGVTMSSNVNNTCWFKYKKNEQFIRDTPKTFTVVSKDIKLGIMTVTNSTVPFNGNTFKVFGLIFLKYGSTFNSSNCYNYFNNVNGLSNRGINTGETTPSIFVPSGTGSYDIYIGVISSNKTIYWTKYISYTDGYMIRSLYNSTGVQNLNVQTSKLDFSQTYR